MVDGRGLGLPAGRGNACRPFEPVRVPYRQRHDLRGLGRGAGLVANEIEKLDETDPLGCLGVGRGLVLGGPLVVRQVGGYVLERVAALNIRDHGTAAGEGQKPRDRLPWPRRPTPWS